MVARRSRFPRRDDWSANWIWCEGDNRPRNFNLYARKSFELGFAPAKASIRITADSRYKLYINGVFVGRGPVKSDPHRQSYDTYDIKDFLVKGQNTFAVLVHHIGQGTYGYMPGRAGLLAEADIILEDGNRKIVTDDTWRVLPAEAWTSAGGRLSQRLGWQEVFDANLEPKDWTAVKFKDAKWPQAKILGGSNMPPFDRLVAREIPHLREEVVYPKGVGAVYECPALPENAKPADMPAFMAEEELTLLNQGTVDKPEMMLVDNTSATVITTPAKKGVVMVLDFGREVFGSLEIEFARSHGGILDIGYSELLDEGRVKPNRGEINYSDRLILRKGKQIWTGFEPRAFRFVQIDIRNCPKPIAISRIAVRETTYPVEWKGSFESSDDLLNRIWKTAGDTARLVMQDTFIDSPWRERAQWWDNAAIAAQTAFYAFGDTQLFRQGLKHISASQDREGIVSALFPSAARMNFPDFGALWVMSVWDYYAMSEDVSLLHDLYPSVVRWLKWIARFTNSSGLLSNVAGDVFIDWAEIDRRGEMAAMNCLYVGALRAASRMAESLKRDRDAGEWASLASSVKVAVAKYFWSPSHGLFADARVDGKLIEHYSRQTNILAALFDIADHYQKASIFRKSLDANGMEPISTPRFMSFLTEGMFKSGYAGYAVDAIRDKWGAMLEKGATTFWEHFEPTDSMCYASSSGPAAQLQAYVLGVRPTGEPGRVRIEPQLADLDWAKGKVTAAGGVVSVEWQRSRRGFTMTIEVPKGMTAEVVPPRETAACRVMVDSKEKLDQNIEVGSGRHRIQVNPCSPRRSRNATCTCPEPVVESLPIPDGRRDIETVEQMIKILSELEREAAERAKEEAEERAAQALLEQSSSENGSSKSKSKRRRPRRPSKHAMHSAEETPAEQAPSVQAEPEPASAAESNVEQSPVAKPRRRRTKAHTPEKPAEEAAPAEAEATAADTDTKKVSKPKTTSRRSRKPAQKSEPVAESEPVEAAEPAKEPAKRPAPRRRRQPAKPKTAEATPEVPKVEAEPAAATELPDSNEGETPNGKKPKRHYRRRKPASHTEPVPEG